MQYSPLIFLIVQKRLATQAWVVDHLVSELRPVTTYPGGTTGARILALPLHVLETT